jgi:hypothetical protein
VARNWLGSGICQVFARLQKMWGCAVTPTQKIWVEVFARVQKMWAGDVYKYSENMAV